MSDHAPGGCQRDDLSGSVRYDIGGWISGPCVDPPLPPEPPVRPVPPGSTALRELLTAVASALTLPAPATPKDELTYLRISRDRARLVLYACRRLLADREADDVDIMITVMQLRDQAQQQPADSYDHHPLRS